MKNRTITTTLLFCLIFGLAFYLRQFTFWLPHWQGDQSQYVILAMKLGERGGISFADYNLSKVNVEVVRISDPHRTEAVYPYRISGEGRGFVMDTYYAQGLHHFDMPFFYKGPMLPIALALSHRIFSGPENPFAVIKSNLGPSVLDLRPHIHFSTQFWAAVVPFASSLLVLLMIFFWSRSMFGIMPALAAAFIMATNPVAILTANRVWTEDLSLLFLTPAMFLYRDGWRVKKPWICVVSGVLLGLAALTNQRLLLAAAALAVYTFLMMGADAGSKQGIRKFLLADGRWWGFAAGLAVMTAPWFWNIYERYGSPFWQPEVFVRMHYGKEIESLGSGANLRDWYRVLRMQPHGLIYYSVGTVAISWPLIAGYASLRDGWSAARSAWTGKAFDERVLFLWCWIGIFAAYFFTQRTGEYRYFFPAYPALVIASGWMWVRWETVLSGITAKRWIATSAVVAALAISAAYSVNIILPILWQDKHLITAPWR